MLTTMLAMLLVQDAPANPAPTPAQQPKCEGEAYDAFDFWVGEWDVYPAGSQQKVAQSKIERLYNGCAVRENWMPFSGGSGGSLNAYDPATGLWHQTWIGSAPGDVVFVGGPVDGAMVINGYWAGALGPGTNPLQRISYTLQDDGSVRQHGEASKDHGLTWSTNFDLIYRPRAEG